MIVHAALPATETEWREYVEARAPFSEEEYVAYEDLLLRSQEALDRFFEKDLRIEW